VAAEAGAVLGGLHGRPFAEPLAVAAAPSIAAPLTSLLDELHPEV
jgi:myo-inositol-1(or 4)-monophosphatase